MADAVFVFDDDCGFCTWWAEFFAARTDLRIVGFSAVGPALRERLPDEYETCSHLLTDGTVYSCGASIEQALLRTGAGSVARPAVDALRRFRAYRWFRERAYRVCSTNRSTCGAFLSKTPPARTTDE